MGLYPRLCTRSGEGENHFVWRAPIEVTPSARWPTKEPIPPMAVGPYALVTSADGTRIHGRWSVASWSLSRSTSGHVKVTCNGPMTRSAARPFLCD